MRESVFQRSLRPLRTCAGHRMATTAADTEWPGRRRRSVAGFQRESAQKSSSPQMFPYRPVRDRTAAAPSADGPYNALSSDSARSESRRKTSGLQMCANF